MFHAHRTLLIFLTLCLSPPMTQAMDTAALFEKTSESVVFIISSTTDRDLGTGSGFAVGNGQFIVTNHHVIDKATKVTVKLSDGRELRAKVLSKDQNHDLAILGID